MRPKSVNVVVWGGTSPTRAQSLPAPLRQIAKAVSLLLLSVQVRVTWVAETYRRVSLNTEQVRERHEHRHRQHRLTADARHENVDDALRRNHEERRHDGGRLR